jgi:hypothetical protein
MLPEAIISTAAILGLLHGLNPTSGWLLALYRALWSKSLKDLLISVSIVGLGHTAAATLTAIPAGLLGVLTNHAPTITAAGLIAFSVYRMLRPRHRYQGMRIGYVSLAAIGVLFALLHGSALSLTPLVSAYCSMAKSLDLAAAAAISLVTIHNLAAYLSMLLVSVLVFLVLGLRILKKLWLNYDLLSNATFLVVGILFLTPEVQRLIAG